MGLDYMFKCWVPDSKDEMYIWGLSGPLWTWKRTRMTTGSYEEKKPNGKIERHDVQTMREREIERHWGRMRHMSDEVCILANAPVNDRTFTVPARNELLSMDKNLAESDPRHTLPDCFSHSPYQADVCCLKLQLFSSFNRWIVVVEPHIMRCMKSLNRGHVY